MTFENFSTEEEADRENIPSGEPVEVEAPRGESSELDALSGAVETPEDGRFAERARYEATELAAVVSDIPETPRTWLGRMGRSRFGHYVVGAFLALTTMGALAPEAEAGNSFDLGRIGRRMQREAEREITRRGRDIIRGKKENKKPVESVKEREIKILERRRQTLEKNRAAVMRRIAAMEAALSRAKSDRQIAAIEERLKEADKEKVKIDNEIISINQSIDRLRGGDAADESVPKTNGKTDGRLQGSVLR